MAYKRKLKAAKATCSAEGCLEPCTGWRSVCTKHYDQQRYHKNREAYKARAKQWAVDNRAKIQSRSKEARRDEYLKWKYGITLDQHDSMSLAQGGACKICRKIPRTHLHVDHCHTTGKVRGLLCAACNTSIGKMKDSVENLRAAADYLESFKNGLEPTLTRTPDFLNYFDELGSKSS